MTDEELNKEKRKYIPLTRNEYLTFFFFPYNSATSSFNDSEDNRFAKYGFRTNYNKHKELGY